MSAASSFELCLSPTFALRVRGEDAAAFPVGSGPLLVWLADFEGTRGLGPAETYWRAFARARLDAEVADGSTALSPAAAARWLESAPAMGGGEYLSPEALAHLWTEVGKAAPPVGRVCLSLAESRGHQLPFALLATYASKLDGARPRHTSLGRALKEQAASGRPAQLADIARVLKEAAARSRFVAELIESKKIFQPQALGVDQAYGFLRDVPALEAAGVMVRIPDWWSAAKPPRPRVTVTVGGTAPVGRGLGSLVDFKVEVSLGGKPLTKEEWDVLRKAVSGLVFLRGSWVEVDAGMLGQVLERWRSSSALAAGQGIPFAKAMRLLVSGVPTGGGGVLMSDAESDAERRWSDVVTGPWLAEALHTLKDPKVASGPDLKAAGVRATLRDYQRRGVTWLWRLRALGLGGLLADDMGLGKTLQVLAYLAASRQDAEGPSLVVAPATLVRTWLGEAAKFTPHLKILGAHPSLMASADIKDNAEIFSLYDVVVTSYGTLLRSPAMESMAWDAVILDEAQAIKNPDTQQAKAVKRLTARHRLTLTGTPVENRPLDLWSLFDFLNPGLLGSAREFSATPPAQVRTLITPYLLRRLKTDKTVAADLPDKTEMEVACGLAPAQAALYERVVNDLKRDLATSDQQRRRGIVLTALLRLKQICDHPCLAIGHGDFAIAGSGKLQRLNALAEEIASRQERLLVFTQFRSMTEVLARELAQVFGVPGLILHGDTPVAERQTMVERFQRDDGPPFFVLSLKAGGTGLTLTAASHVVHFDRWWNPAVEDQATDRAYRIGQRRNVLVHKFACIGTVEARVAALLAEKRGVAKELLSGDSEVAFTELSDDELLRLVALDITSATLETS